MRRTTFLTIACSLVFASMAWWTHARAAKATRSPDFFSEASASAPPIPSPTTSRKLDEYGNIKWSDEKARLDNFAIELQNDPSAVGYITCYGGRVGRAGEAQRRCHRAVGYVIGHRRIEASRLVAADGGYKEDLTVELWALPSWATPPSPAPTVDPSEVKIIRSKTKGRTRRKSPRGHTRD